MASCNDEQRAVGCRQEEEERETGRVPDPVRNLREIGFDLQFNVFTRKHTLSLYVAPRE